MGGGNPLVGLGRPSREPLVMDGRLDLLEQGQYGIWILAQASAADPGMRRRTWTVDPERLVG